LQSWIELFKTNSAAGPRCGSVICRLSVYQCHFNQNKQGKSQMQQKFVLTIKDIEIIAAAAEAYALQQAWPVSIAILDDGAHLLYFKRLQGAAALSAEIAQAKAKTAALSGRDSQHYEKLLADGRLGFLSLPISGLVTGAVAIKYQQHVLGAVGVSGVASEQDAAVAQAGIDAWLQQLASA
jgi:glc operon protein GlcG